jgi:hypothetical protein
MIAMEIFQEAAGRVDRHSLRRALAAGGAWGVVVAAGLTAAQFWACGTVCLDDVAVTTALSLTGGLAAMGPLALFGARPPKEARPPIGGHPCHA